MLFVLMYIILFIYFLYILFLELLKRKIEKWVRFVVNKEFVLKLVLYNIIIFFVM